MLRRFSVDAAAEHFVPSKRLPARNRQLKSVLLQLWKGRDFVEVRRCEACGFAFASPFVAGNPDFYNLVSGQDPHYPRHRWEFDLTLRSLRYFTRTGTRVRLIEAGAGDGGFLRQLTNSSIGHLFDVLALEYDEGALRSLRKAGFRAERGSITSLADKSDAIGAFHVICLFQTLEHMDNIHEAFETFRSIGAPGGHVYLSVPYGPSIWAQEELVRLWDMPPNHIGRWNPNAFKYLADQYGLTVVDQEIEPYSWPHEPWRLALYKVNGEAYDVSSLAGRVQAINSRLVRGVLKRVLALLWFPLMTASGPRTSGHSQWVHLRLPTNNA